MILFTDGKFPILMGVVFFNVAKALVDHVNGGACRQFYRTSPSQKLIHFCFILLLVFLIFDKSKSIFLIICWHK